jgi:hypothetical protein
MTEFRKPGRGKKELQSLALRTLAAAALLVITTLLLRAAWGMYTKMIAASEGQRQTENQLARLEKQQKGVVVTLSELASVRGEEEEIRQRFGLVKPGEGEIQIIERAQASSTALEDGEPWWRHILRALVVW